MLPKHIALIVDGNRRWAKSQGLPVITGHRLAANKRLEEIIYHCLKLGIPYVTFWVWSTENWKRGQRFASMMFNILKLGLRRNIDKFVKDGVKLNTIGDLAKLPEDLLKEINKVKEKSKQNDKITVTIAINYGGRDEIVRAIGRLRLKIKDQREKITEEEFSKYLDTRDLPDPDLIIRTAGEKRLSGFLLWQSAYSEFYFTDTLFPDFTSEELDKALEDYALRKRNYGK